MSETTLSRTARKIVDEIVNNLTDRRGLRQEWDQIDEDIQDEIKDEWTEIVMSNLVRL